MGHYSFSASKNTFYANVLKEIQYMPNGAWPDDAIDIDDNLHHAYTSTPPDGKRLGSEDGQPVWIDIPPPTDEELIAAADSEKQSLINAANNYMNSRQWPGKAAIGRLKDDELAQYNLWLNYLDALEAIDTSSAPDISWPSQPVTLVQ
ncbi:tail fiber assembly protein [Intestinirhabdus alba]|uniref:Tail fiber assembly protein n=1 Tax=Intestinirhabdus alba TaxID=2899544 RepID=A0A6L6IQT5_9ENTR|nr:tail fiber assembly protein [Intestinirhabdus alba]MTH48595.1 tail fiber assembly protein [Intestinirhabdus alba]